MAKFEKKMLDSHQEGGADAEATVRRGAAGKRDEEFAKRGVARAMDRADAAVREVKARGGVK